MLSIASVIINNLFIFFSLSFLYSEPFYLLSFSLFTGSYFNTLVLFVMFVILCRNPFIGFDAAKVRRFLLPAKLYHELCSQTASLLTKVKESPFICFFNDFFINMPPFHVFFVPLWP